MSDYAEEVAYNRSLYAKSDRERLRRINYTRKREGRPLLASLEQSTKLRLPLEARNASA